jgi:ferric-dicitrate binding protein FerR (iron transport regulator)
MTYQQPDSEQLIAYFEGKITDTALRAEIEDYISGADPLFIQECMQTAWDRMDNGVIPRSVPADWDTFRMMAGIRTVRKMNVRKMLAAAAAVLLLGTGAAMYFLRQQHEASAVVVWQQVSANPRELRTVHLPDGSNITLFPGARISYNNQYNKEAREIRLQGRAYFDITAAAGKPFSVATGKYTTQVLGTSFEVADKPEDKTLAVTLVSGKVRLLDAQQHTLSELRPDQQMIIRTENARFNIVRVNANSLITWTRGHLSYDQVALADVCRELEDWYGARITIHRAALGKKHITAGFERMSLQAVMNILAETAAFTYKEVNGNIEIY